MCGYTREVPARRRDFSNARGENIMASVYKARWNKAKALALDILRRQAEAEKKFGKKAMLVEDDELVEGELIVEDDQIYIQMSNCHRAVFEDNPLYDHGSYHTIKQIEEYFSKFEIYVPYKG
jgi:hypothetical protein